MANFLERLQHNLPFPISSVPLTMKKKVSITTFEADEDAMMEYMLKLSMKERLDFMELARMKAYGKLYTEYKPPSPAKPVIVYSSRKPREDESLQ